MVKNRNPGEPKAYTEVSFQPSVIEHQKDLLTAHPLFEMLPLSYTILLSYAILHGFLDCILFHQSCLLPDQYPWF